MRKTNVIKMIELLLFLLVFSLLCSNKVQASEASLTATNCNLNEKFTVTVNMPSDIIGYEGILTITYSDSSSVRLDTLANMQTSYTGNYSDSFTAQKAGNAVITVSGLKLYSMSSLDNLTTENMNFAPVNSNTTLTTTITITDPTPVQPEQPVENTDTSSDTPSAPEQPAPDPVVINFKDTNETMYTIRRVNVRQNYGTDSGIIQTLAEGTEVTRTGIGDKDKDGYSWSRISYNGITGYMITGALTYDAPELNENPLPDEEKPEENPEGTVEEKPEETLDISEENKAKIEALSKKLGTIPEVGINIMPFFFLGSCVSCIVLIIKVKRNR